MPPEEILRKREQHTVRMEYEALEKLYTETRDDVRRHAIKRRMDVLAKQSIMDGGEPLNMDETIRKLDKSGQNYAKLDKALSAVETMYNYY